VLTRTLAAIEVSELRPAALLFTGDLTEAGAPEAYQRLRALVEPVAARMGTTALYVMGNHDSRPDLREHLLGEARGDEPYDYTVRLGGLRVVVLDTTVPGYSHTATGNCPAVRSRSVTRDRRLAARGRRGSRHHHRRSRRRRRPHRPRLRQPFTVCFHASPTPGTPQPRPDHSETSDAAWTDPTQLDALPVHPAMRRWIDDALTRRRER
jgi:3',5'-cyclic AMP phosphodiesterase CpdA